MTAGIAPKQPAPAQDGRQDIDLDRARSPATSSYPRLPVPRRRRLRSPRACSCAARHRRATQPSQRQGEVPILTPGNLSEVVALKAIGALWGSVPSGGSMPGQPEATRRRVVVGLAAIGSSVAAGLPVLAQANPPYPTRPIRIVVGFGPGGGNDLLARLIGQKLAERLGQAVVVENKPASPRRVRPPGA